MTSKEVEEYCRGAFDEYLRDEMGVDETSWRPEPNGKTTPPDYHLSQGGVMYAVEVTALFTQYEQENGESLSDHGLWEVATRLVKEVEQQARSEGRLRGSYMLTLQGPYHNFLQSKKEVKKELFDFISRTREDDTVALTPYHLPCGQNFFLWKVGTRVDRVGLGTHADGTEWDWGVVAGLRRRVESAVADKTYKLRGIPAPWVLLLLDTDPFSQEIDYDDLRDELAAPGKHLDALSKFHSVYMVHRSGLVFPLYPRREVS
jgi:hypothetical protein